MKAAIIGIAGPALTVAEADLLTAHRPLGVILFARNIETPDRLIALTAHLRRLLPDGAIMIDQEGGRVARLRPPLFDAHPACGQIGALPDLKAARAAWLQGALIGAQCHAVGIDLVAAPVLDRHVAGAHDVIGDRAFSSDPARCAALGRAMADGLLAAGVMPIGKHAPGHGRAGVDSHLSLPRIDDLDPADLAPFIANRDLPWLMTAHILLPALDPDRPATLSAKIIGGVIRDRIGFDGLLVTDDLDMRALSGDVGDLARGALAAGCDVALQCAGIAASTARVLESVPQLSPAAFSRLDRARALAKRATIPINRPALAAERADLLTMADP